MVRTIKWFADLEKVYLIKTLTKPKADMQGHKNDLKYLY